MAIRYPAPLRPGDRIGVTAPSAGVPDRLWPRFEFGLRCLRDCGFEVALGGLVKAPEGGPAHLSGPREARAAELMAMLVDPSIRAVVPPWGGQTSIDIVELLDLDAVAAADPTWCVGFSDTTTWQTPLTLGTGTASIHGWNLLDTPYTPPDGMLHWLDVATADPGAELVQRPPGRHRAEGWDDYVAHPTVTDQTLEATGSWTRIDPSHEDEPATFSGRLIGGCVETLGLVPRPWVDVPAFVREHAPEGVVVLLDVSEWPSPDIARALHSMRLAGWFDAATGVLLSRTRAPEQPHFSQHDAVRDALGMLGLPIVADVECGHVPPLLPLVLGAPTTVAHERGGENTVTQTLA
jgi:muramoyltetrapeptide carboxypeptidase